jgi:hypothetical protein
MPGNRFQQELDKLESLLDNLNAPTASRKSRSRSPAKGGAKKASKSPKKVAKKSKSPKKASKSPRKVAKKSKSPKKASKSPRKVAKKSKSPRKASKSPKKASKSPKRKASKSPRRKMSGGGKINPLTKEEVKYRHFKIVEVSGKSVDDDGRYNLPEVTSKGKPQKRGPKEMASKAFTQLCKKHKRGDECHFKFAIQETTRGSNRKVYHYEGKRVKLAKVESYKTKGGKTIERKYRNELKSLGSSAEQSQKGGWVFYN